MGVCMLMSRLGLATMTFAGSSLLFAKSILPAATTPARLAIYYGYPSLVNGANGDLEKAARVFSAYDVVVLGDGLEIPDQQSGRCPPGDAGEHQKTIGIIAAVRALSPATRSYGYSCLSALAS